MGKMKSLLIAPLMLLALPAQALACSPIPPSSPYPEKNPGESETDFKIRENIFWKVHNENLEREYVQQLKDTEASLWDRATSIVIYKVSRVQFIPTNEGIGSTTKTWLDPIKSVRDTKNAVPLNLNSEWVLTSCGPEERGENPGGAAGDLVIGMAFSGPIDEAKNRWFYSKKTGLDHRTIKSLALAELETKAKQEKPE
jgi:hypothetical protein